MPRPLLTIDEAEQWNLLDALNDHLEGLVENAACEGDDAGQAEMRALYDEFVALHNRIATNLDEDQMLPWSQRFPEDSQ